MLNFETHTHYQRFMLGVICGLLPIACLLFGILGHITGMNYENWYVSISATYFANSSPCMVWSLGLCSFFLFTYQGYVDRQEEEKVKPSKRIIRMLAPKELFRLTDRKLTLVAAVSAILIVACPCAAKGSGEYLGLFALPSKISDTMHSISAAALFMSFALMILTQFTKGSHKRRNVIYYVCGSIMLASMLGVVLGMFLDFVPYMTMIFEFIMLEAFAVAWIIKSGVIHRI